MTGNIIEFAILSRAVRGVKGFKADFRDCGSMLSISFIKGDVRLSFFLGKNGRSLVTYKIFYNEFPRTKEREVTGADILDLIFKEALTIERGEMEE